MDDYKEACVKLYALERFEEALINRSLTDIRSFHDREKQIALYMGFDLDETRTQREAEMYERFINNLSRP